MRALLLLVVLASLGCGDEGARSGVDAGTDDNDGGSLDIGKDEPSDTTDDPPVEEADVRRCVPFVACFANTFSDGEAFAGSTQCATVDEELYAWAICSTDFPCRDDLCRDCLINTGEYCSQLSVSVFGCISAASRAGLSNDPFVQDVNTFYNGVCHDDLR